jgi:hypothetical protein
VWAPMEMATGNLSDTASASAPARGSPLATFHILISLCWIDTGCILKVFDLVRMHELKYLNFFMQRDIYIDIYMLLSPIKNKYQ